MFYLLPPMILNSTFTRVPNSFLRSHSTSFCKYRSLPSTMRFCDFLSTRNSCSTDMLLSGFRDSALRVARTRTRTGAWLTKAVGKTGERHY